MPGFIRWDIQTNKGHGSSEYNEDARDPTGAATYGATSASASRIQEDASVASAVGTAGSELGAMGKATQMATKDSKRALR
jgi:hypothetical protein